MRSKLLAALIGTGALALLAALAEAASAPLPVRVVLGLPLVLLLPGFATVSALLPERELSWGERVLASLGASVVISICVSVLLAASPIGFSRGSAAAVLGVGTAGTAFWAWARTRRIDEEDRGAERMRRF
jgi:uncharacterized membrane protein